MWTIVQLVAKECCKDKRLNTKKREKQAIYYSAAAEICCGVYNIRAGNIIPGFPVWLVRHPQLPYYNTQAIYDITKQYVIYTSRLA